MVSLSTAYGLCIDPLEIAPMGYCDLREIKKRFGRKIALKGNLHTTEVILQMDAAGVERAARECLEAGMEGGGFILSTGDQCGGIHLKRTYLNLLRCVKSMAGMSKTI